MDAVQREDSPEEIGGHPLAARHKTFVLDLCQELVNVYQGSSFRLRLSLYDLVVRVNPRPNNTHLRRIQHNVGRQRSQRRICESRQNQWEGIRRYEISRMDSQYRPYDGQWQASLRRHFFGRCQIRNNRDIGNVRKN